MCGIVGIYDRQRSRVIDQDLLVRMNDTQIHRGPDESGIFTDLGIGLGHRRLSIIDLASGKQPLFNEDGQVVVVYNGEIYNFQELSRELTALGHRFRTHCDTEVIVHAWEEWGQACVDRFRGMFAFAVWDGHRRELFLARDRLGIKPLYYCHLPDGRFLFSSELKGLLCHPDVPRVIDPRAVDEYFAYGYVPEPRTIFRGVYKLPPGHTLLVDGSETPAEPVRYWDVQFPEYRDLTEDEWREELLVRLEEAVRIRLVAEVPLGAFLSGGVDSSAVVAMMAGISDTPVNTCSISFSDPEFDEAAYASQVASRYGTDHRVETVDVDDFDLVDALSGIYDEPFADSSALPTYRVCQLARRHVTVALSGDGGDEILAGYRRYKWHLYEERLRRLLPLSVRRPLFGALAAAYPKADWAPRVLRAKATFETLARDSVEGYFHSVSILGDNMRRSLFSTRFLAALDGYRAVDVLRRYASEAPAHPLSCIQYLDIKTYLVGDILTKVDRASMANSLEVRVPLLDHKLVEWAATMPPELKLRNGEGKYIFKKAMEPYLPNGVLYRNKMGFAVPLARWFRGPLRERIEAALTREGLLDLGIFDPKTLERLVRQHVSGSRDHSAALWTLLMFESFWRRYSDSGVGI